MYASINYESYYSGAQKAITGPTNCSDIGGNRRESYPETSKRKAPLEDVERQTYLDYMVKDYETMVNNKEFSDFTFTVKQKKYFAHKCVLASRSPVFASMFRSNMSETQTNNVVINDCGRNVFEVFLKYLYTGDISKLKQFVFELFPIADKYEVIPLKEFCGNSIEIENENAIKVLIMANLYNEEKLKKKAINYIAKNLRAIRSSFADEFQQLINDYPVLVNDIFAAIDTNYMHI